ncbi:MAG: manganese efflux pump MntP family protein [Clostridiales bacterium]|jgi:putative Mn2+ efflux pump MntP|nr:manganese efflux pump MntP family protein [Clostridiales bacterium]
MTLGKLFMLSIGLAMDAFAVAVCAGLTMRKTTFQKYMVIGLYFGLFQAVMPLIGYAFATLFADKIIGFDHWVAFVLLCIIGGKMVLESFKKEGCNDRKCPEGFCEDRSCPPGGKPDDKEMPLSPAKMIPFALATSIDALAIGVSFALFEDVSIVPAVSMIGITTFVLSVVGVKIGNVFGIRYKSKAELVGGIILILIGFQILLEHMGIL